MALTKKEQGIITSVSNSLFGGLEAFHSAAVMGIKRAYSAQDGGEFLSSLGDNIPTGFKKALGTFARRYGVNVTMEGKSVTFGGVIKADRAYDAIKKASADVGGLVALVDQHVPDRKKRESRKDATTWADAVGEANKALEGMVKRTKEARPEVGAALNQLIQRPAWVARFTAMGVTDDEIDLLVEALVEYRAADALERKAA